MKKTLIAAAVVGMFAASVANAQTANVTLYGRLNMSLESVSQAGGWDVLKDSNGVDRFNEYSRTYTRWNGDLVENEKYRRPIFGRTGGSNSPGRVQRISSNDSRFGIRGSEDLGGGLSAIFQVESSILADAGDGTLAVRDTYLGLQGSWGSVKLGKMLTPYDAIHGIWGNAPTALSSILNTKSLWATQSGLFPTGDDDYRYVYNPVYDSDPLNPSYNWKSDFLYNAGTSVNGDGFRTGKGAQSKNTSPAGGFGSRPNNSIRYDSADLNGLTFAAQLSLDEKDRDTYRYGLNVVYSKNALQIGGAVEYVDYGKDAGEYDDFTYTYANGTTETISYLSGGRNASDSDLGITLAAGYDFGFIRPAVVYEYQLLDVNDDSYDRHLFGLSVTAPLGAGKLYAAGVYAAKWSDTSKTDAWQAEVSYTYPLSKRTSIYGGYALIQNNTNANYVLGNKDKSYGGVGGTGSKSRPNGIIFGMVHNF